MILSKRLIILALMIIVFFPCESVFANGINPPRPKGNSTVTAICVERSTERRIEIIRAVIKTEDVISKILNYQIGNARNQLVLTDIKSLTLSADAVDTEGFAKAVLVRYDGSTEKSLSVLVKSNDKNIFIQGYDKNGLKVSVALSECAFIEFSSVTSDINDAKGVAEQ